MKNYPTYDEIKDSGIEWLGEIPAHWEVTRFKWLFNLIYRYPTYYDIDYQETGIIEVRGEMLKGGTIDLNCKPRYISKKTANNFPKTCLEKGDIVMSVRGTMGKIGLVTKNLEGANITANLLRLSPKNKLINSKWLSIFMQSSLFESVLNSFSTQTTIKTITVPDLTSILMPLPQLIEQKAIADFLDKETNNIDKLIEKKEQLIKLLEEKRQVLISQAVTKGLNPDVEMKDSEARWLGKVPKYWEVKKIKWLSQVKRGASPRPIDDPKYFNQDGEYSWVRISDVSSSDMYLEETEQTLSELGASLSVKLEPNELFLSICASVGKPCITKIKCCIHDGFVYFPDNNQNTKFLYYIFKAGECYKGLGKKGTQLNLNTDTVGGVQIALPPLEEQKEIVNYLDERTSKIDTLIEKIKEQIANLKEYRQTLISNTVTGKIDVRDLE